MEVVSQAGAPDYQLRLVAELRPYENAGDVIKDVFKCRRPGFLYLPLVHEPDAAGRRVYYRLLGFLTGEQPVGNGQVEWLALDDYRFHRVLRVVSRIHLLFCIPLLPGCLERSRDEEEQCKNKSPHDSPPNMCSSRARSISRPELRRGGAAGRRGAGRRPTDRESLKAFRNPPVRVEII